MDLFLPCLLAFDSLLACHHVAARDATPFVPPRLESSAPAPSADAPADAVAPDAFDPRASGRYRLRFDLPLFETLEHTNPVTKPSMRQSLVLTKDFFYLAHLPAMELARVLGGGEWLAVGAVDIGLALIGFGSPWLHEEWHRAVMTQRDIDSFNGVYDLSFGASVIPVREVQDEDLAALKREHPAEMVRLSSAGFEAQYSLGLEFDKDRFFFGTRGATRFQQWFDLINAFGYLRTSAFSSESATREIIESEGTDIGARDFTGLDPVAWVYDLHRPDEPYEARGVHPSGVGVDRYRTESDLTPAERSYLRRQSWLAALNFLDPQLFGIDAFEHETAGGTRIRWNASVQHFLAPFGASTNLNGFLQVDEQRWFFQLHAHQSDSLVLPGLTVQMIRVPARITKMTQTFRLWLQPEDQRFFARRAELGAASESRFNLELGNDIELYWTVDLKTAGWVTGTVALGPEWSTSIGFEAIAF